MRKPTSRIRAEIAGLQEALRAAETREAERIGRIALRAGLGEIDVEDGELQTAFEQIVRMFRNARTSAGEGSSGKDGSDTSKSGTTPFSSGAPAGSGDEA
jgi:hypothetical protein